MVAFDASNSHFEYMDVIRHWSPVSEKYAGGDALITLMSNGWQIGETVFYEEYWHAGSRLVMIYHVKMTNDGTEMQVPVLSNPYVNRMMMTMPVQVRPLAERVASRIRQ